ncbi:MAG TPA: hypothetical protein VK810_02630 [Dongiaceae bacterium]|jgi:hypothetical protein|nr:hypothetical protein [Dongiaceae bacterium]
MKNILKISLFAAAIAVAPALSRAQDMTNQPPSAAPAAPAQVEPAPVVAPPTTEIPVTNAPAKPKKMRTSLVASGKVLNVDTNAMTLTVGKHTFEITSDTRITKGGQPAILSDIAVDDKVGVSYKKAGDKLNAMSVSDGKKSEKSGGETNSVSGQK